MEIFEKLCLEIIERIEEYVREENYSEIKKYIEKKKIEVENCRIALNNESKYIETLVKELK